MRLLLVALALFSVVAYATDVTILTPDNFDLIVDGSKDVLVEFFAPWCGHCKTLAPEYEIAATAFKKEKGVVIASVDADAHKDLGSRFGVTGFPTLKFFAKGGDLKAPKDYQGGRTAADIVEYINNAAGVRGVVKKAPSAVVTLTTANFDQVVDGSKNVLVEFYAPWCGHCKTLAPKYEDLGKIFANEPNVVIAKVDADAATGRPLGEKFGVKGFPTIKFFPKGNTVADEYNGGREVADFVTFLNEKAGTKRTTTGLADDAGRIAALDVLAQKLVTGEAKSIVADLKAASSGLTSAEDKESSAFYILVGTKIETQGLSFVSAQLARLRKLAESESITGAKRDEFSRKIHVLEAFEKK